MTLAHSFALAFTVVALSAGAAHADIVVPERDACRGKSQGDRCGSGKTCHFEGFECQAGSCRRFSTAEECAKGGCSWEMQLSCKPGAAKIVPSEPTLPIAPTPAPVPTDPSPAPEAAPETPPAMPETPPAAPEVPEAAPASPTPPATPQAPPASPEAAPSPAPPPSGCNAGIDAPSLGMAVLFGAVLGRRRRRQ